MGILIAFPWIALIVAGGLACMAWFRRSKVAAVTALLWAAYAGYEYLMLTRVLCTGECNIRVDLLMIYPVLLILTVVSIVRSLKTRSR